MRTLLILMLFITNSQFAQPPGKPICELKDISSPAVQDENTIYNVAGVHVKPEFPGGNNELYSFINSNFHTDKNDLNGKIYAMFVVEKDGTLSNIKIIRDLGNGTNEEALRVLKLLPKWIPGKLNGVAVRTLYTMPLTVKNGVGGNNADVKTVDIPDKNSSSKKTK